MLHTALRSCAKLCQAMFRDACHHDKSYSMCIISLDEAEVLKAQPEQPERISLLVGPHGSDRGRCLDLYELDLHCTVEGVSDGQVL